jgi:hypothetical protein
MSLVFGEVFKILKPSARFEETQSDLIICKASIYGTDT